MMGLFASIVLAVVGGLCISEKLNTSRASLRLGLEMLSPMRGYIGILSMFHGLITLVKTLLGFPNFLLDPFVYLASLGGGALAIAAGGCLGYPIIKGYLQKYAPSQNVSFLETGYNQVQRHKTTLGYASIACGMFFVVLRIFG